MQRVPWLPFLVVIAGAAVATLHAQQTSRKSAKDPRRPFSLLVPNIPTVTDAPFTAQYEIQVQRPVDGRGSETWQSTTMIARDSSGRIRHELHDYVPASFTKEPPLQCVILTDPVARLRHTLDRVRQTDDRQWFHVSPSGRLEPRSSTGEDLGTKIMYGLEVNGERNAWTYSPRGASRLTDKAVDEIWYSNELHLIVFEQQRDSAGGVFTIAMSKFNRSEPPASLFKVPRGYHLPIPPGSHSGAPAISWPNYDPSMGPPDPAW